MKLASARERLKRNDPLRILVAFVKNVRAGYRFYAKLLRRHGEKTSILMATWRGTGDYYLCAMYLEPWLQKNGIQEYVFVTPGGAEERVLALFPRIAAHAIHPFDQERDFFRLLEFAAFLGIERCRCHGFHQQHLFPASPDLNLCRGDLQGFRNLTLADFYRRGGFGLSGEIQPDKPVFLRDETIIRGLFKEYGLKPGKTVLLAPYSTGLEAYSPGMAFWSELARALREKGYAVCTNCAGDQAAVPGTAGLSLPYERLVPFLERAGGFVGIRSGLCEIVSTARCKKIVLHTHGARWWPAGRSIAFTGLGHMGLCEDATEIMLDAADDHAGICRRILREIESES